MDPIWTAYETWCVTERNLSRRTLRAYRQHWTAALGIIHGLPGRGTVGIEAILLPDLRAVVAVLAGRLAPASRCRALTAFRVVLAFAVREGLRADNPALRLPFPRVPRRVPNVLARDAVAQLLDAPWPASWLGTRNRAVTEVLYGCGVRVEEGCGLTLESLDWPQALVRVLGKGSKERVLPVPGRALTALRTWLGVRPATVRAALFVGVRGQPLGASGVRHMLRRRSAGLGLPHIWPHRLRAAYATHLLAGGADVRDVQALLGHESLDTTRAYLGPVETARLVRVVERAHPRA